MRTYMSCSLKALQSTPLAIGPPRLGKPQQSSNQHRARKLSSAEDSNSESVRLSGIALHCTGSDNADLTGPGLVGCLWCGQGSNTVTFITF